MIQPFVAQAPCTQSDAVERGGLESLCLRSAVCTLERVGAAVIGVDRRQQRLDLGIGVELPGLDLDTPVKKAEPSSDVKDETPLPNIWNFENEPEEDTFDKPSFLRRLTRRKKDDTSKDEEN